MTGLLEDQGSPVFHEFAQAQAQQIKTNHGVKGCEPGNEMM